MRSNYVHFGTPQFRLLSDSQIEELHYATLHILARTGVTVECQEAIDLLGEAGADVSNPKRVKIPANLVEQAIRTAPKSFTLYTREGEPAIVLDGTKKSHFGAISDNPDYLDPYTRQSRPCYVDDIANTGRLCDVLPNIEWIYTIGSFQTLPGTLAEKVAFLQTVLNTSKPITANITTLSSFKEVFKACSMIAGSERELQAKPFLIATSAAASPLMLGKESLEKSLLCAEKGIPNEVACGPMAGATAPATFPGILVIANAELLSHIVISQLKNPGTPIIMGGTVTIMDMRTTIFSYAAPEMSFLVAALTEMSHYYKIPIMGTAGVSDAAVIGTQAGAEVAYQVLLSALCGADFVHDAGLAYHSKMISPELIVLTDEIIDMVKITMSGLEINEETLALDLIERVGPGEEYIAQSHTLKHFREFWVPTLFDRSLVKGESKHCEELLNEKTLEILKTHKPKQLPEELVKDLKKLEGTWFDQVGLKHEYPTPE